MHDISNSNRNHAFQLSLNRPGNPDMHVALSSNDSRTEVLNLVRYAAEYQNHSSAIVTRIPLVLDTLVYFTSDLLVQSRLAICAIDVHFHERNYKLVIPVWYEMTKDSLVNNSDV